MDTNELLTEKRKHESASQSDVGCPLVPSVNFHLKNVSNTEASFNGEDKESAPPNPRESSKRKQLSVRFAPLPLMSDKITKTTTEPERIIDDDLPNVIRILNLIWARHQARRAMSQYKPRIAVTFQPGLTPKYLKYALAFPFELNNLQADVTEAQQKQFNDFIANLEPLRRNIHIVNDYPKFEVEQLKEPAIVVIQTEHLYRVPMLQLIRNLSQSQHSVLVWTKPWFGLDIAKLEKHLQAHVRIISFPRLNYHDHARSKEYSKYPAEQFVHLAGLPSLIEGEQRFNEKNIKKLVVDELALWRKHELVGFKGLFVRLFDMAQSNAQISAKDVLQHQPYLAVLDTAVMLGFEVCLASRTLSTSDGASIPVSPTLQALSGTPSKALKSGSGSLQYQSEETYALVANSALIDAFANKFPGFEVFKLLRDRQLLWLETEFAIARAMGSCNSQQTMGQRWCFLKGTFVDPFRCDIELTPQVIPKVLHRAKAVIGTSALERWQGERLSPPVATMDKRSWKTLFGYLETRQTIMPVSKSKSPDYMVYFTSGVDKYLLCFQAKTGAQDNSVKKLIKEVAKSPFVNTNKTGDIIWTGNADDRLTFVYLAPNHTTLKRDLQQSEDIHDEFILIKSGCKCLELPPQVEVVVLRKAGIQALFGEQGYQTLIEPQEPTPEMLETELESVLARYDGLTEDEIVDAFIAAKVKAKKI